MNPIKISILVSILIFVVGGCAYQDGGEVKLTANLILENHSDETIYSLRVSEDNESWGDNRFLIQYPTGLPPGYKFYLTLETCDKEINMRIDFFQLGTNLFTDTETAYFECNRTVTWRITSKGEGEVFY
jgi:hypothetical protein